MPAIDFPAAPAVNDEYSFEGRTWRWNGTGWEVKEYPAALLAGTAANPSLYFSGDPNTGLYSPGADQVAISTGGTGRLFVDASGRVGIGTSAPADLFQVIGGNIAADNTDGRRIAFNIGDTFSASVTTATYGLTRGPAGTNTIGLSGFAGLGFYTNNTERLRITSAGLVGIGTSSPGATLDVNGATRVVSGFSNGARIFNNAADANSRSWRLINDLNAYGDFAIQQSTTQTGTTYAARIYVNASGNVGIGTTSPATLLQCQQASAGTVGTFNLTSSTGGGAEIRVANGYSSTVPIYSFWFNNTTGIGNPAANEISAIIAGSERARIDSSGRLLVGTSSAVSTAALGAAQVQVVGTDNLTSQLVVSRFSNDADRGRLCFIKSRGSSGTNTIVQADDAVGRIEFLAADGSGSTAYPVAAHIGAFIDGTPGTNDMPGRLVFSTTADGAASPTERLRITSAGVLQIADAGNISVGTTTGTKIGTATTQKLGFYNATPVVQPAAVANATDAASVITQLNDLLAKLRTLGIIAT